MLGRFYQFSSEIVGRAISALIPVFFSPLGLEQELQISRTQSMLKAAEKTLLGNASYYLERKFRINLLTILKGWGGGQTTFDTAKEQLDDLIATRNPIVARIISYYGVSQLLMAFGFFSSSQKIILNKVSASKPSLANLGARFGILRRTGFGNAHRIWRDVVRVRLRSESPFSNSTRNYISINNTSPNPNPNKILIVATGPKDGSFSFDGYEVIFFIVTANSRIEDLAALLKNCSVNAVLNYEFVKTSLSGIRSEEWKKILLSCREIYSKPVAIQLASQIIGKDVKDGSSNLLHLWGSVGRANMAQWATGLSLKLFGGNPRISLIGTSFYAGDQIYQRTNNDEPKGHNETKKEFDLCISLAMHNPMINFLIMKKLWMNNRIDGDVQFSNVIEKSVENYLNDLDACQGKKRA